MDSNISEASKYPNIHDVSRVSVGTYRSSSSPWRLFSNRLKASGQSHVSSSPVRNFPQKTLWKFEGTREYTVYASWWLNQPLWKICSSNWIQLPQVGRGKTSKNVWVATTQETCQDLDWWSFQTLQIDGKKTVLLLIFESASRFWPFNRPKETPNPCPTNDPKHSMELVELYLHLESQVPYFSGSLVAGFRGKVA